MTDWSVAMTAPNSEATAQLNLEQQGYSCYLPRCMDFRNFRGRRRRTTVLLFSRYIFISITDRWKSIAGTRGISRLVMNGEVPSLVQRGFVEGLRSREVDGLIQLAPRAIRSPGEKVEIKHGPFEGLSAIYQGMSAQDREMVLISLLGRKIQLTLEAGSLD